MPVTARVCVGVHVHAGPAELRATLASLRADAALPFRLVLLPDGPDAQVRAALGALPDVPQLGSTEPRGPPACFNRLVAAGEADVFVLLESGSQVAPGCLRRLVEALSREPGHGLAGPSTNLAWNEQGAFPGAPASALVATARAAEARFGDGVRALAPLHSLSDFCYAVRRDVVEAVGVADEGYGLGPCWEMDYNVRAARAGFAGVWVGAAYVHRAPFTERRRTEEARRFDASRRRYQDKFCARRLRAEPGSYEPHCKGDACEDFAPPSLIRIHEPAGAAPPAAAAAQPAPLPPVTAPGAPAITCIMPTRDRRAFVPQAIRYFLRQDLPDAELVIVDDGADPVGDCVPAHPRLRYVRLEGRRTVGAKRNEACRLARGELIAHWDDDDWYAPSRLSRQLEAVRAGAELCGSGQEYFYEPSSDRAWRYRYLGGERMLVGTSLMYRKRVWERSPFAEIQIGEDVRFVRAAAARACDLADPSLWVGTVHAGNTSPKLPDAIHWHPLPSSDLRAVVGDDLAFLRLRAAPLVSCIMPTCDRRPFVALALRLFQEQAWPNRELVVVDDGSDPVGDLVTGPGTRYVRLHRRASIGAKRNLACREARGEIIAHWDDDDWYGPARLAHQVAAIVAGEADLTGLENRFVLDAPRGSFWTVRGALHRRMFVGDVHGGTLVYRRSLLASGLCYPDANLAEDAALIREAVRRGARLLRLGNPGLFVYVRHGRNAWRFDVGSFLDPAGWETIAPPPELPRETLEAYRAAARVDGD